MALPPLSASDLDGVIDKTRDLWRNLAGERLFITGGTGFFGVWLLESFMWADRRLSLNARAVVLSRNPEAFAAKLPHLAASPAISFIRGDATSFAFPDGAFAALIHAATESYAGSVDRMAIFERDITATRRTLEFALHSRATRYLFTSSGAVYGKQPSELSHVPETYLGAPDPSDMYSGYAQSKRVSEFLCTLFTRQTGLEAKIARCFAFVGPHLPLSLNFAIGNFLRDAMAGGPIRIEGDGTPFRSYMYASELAVWLWTILFRGIPARPYNVGSDQALSISDLAQEVASVVAPGVKIETAVAPKPGTAPSRYVPTVDRARDELGLRADISLRDAIRRTVAWHTRRTN